MNKKDKKIYWRLVRKCLELLGAADAKDIVKIKRKKLEDKTLTYHYEPMHLAMTILDVNDTSEELAAKYRQLIREELSR